LENPKPVRHPLCFAIDANGFNPADEQRYLEDLFIPGILRAGGLGNAAALIHPRRLLLHNTRGVFDMSRANAAYGLPGADAKPAALLVHAEMVGERGLAHFMTE
jgi:hypothetical protein